MTISVAASSMAGMMPAANRSEIDTPPPAEAEYRIMLCEGGTSRATRAAEMVTLTA